MKKLIAILSVMVLFTFVGIQDADAYTRSSSRSSFKSSSYKSSTTRSYTKSRITTKSKSYHLKSPSTSKIKKGTPSTSKKSVTAKPKVDITKKSTTPKTSASRKITTTHKKSVVNNHTVVYKTKYVSPPRTYSHSYYDSHYGRYPYYHDGSFTNQLITAAGVYLFLESFDDDGNPVYVDDDGSRVTGSALNNAKPYQDSSGGSGWAIFFGTLLGVLILSGLGYFFFRNYKVTGKNR
jgi:hypothetical protein